MWTKPEGKSSFYRVQWTHGNVTGRDNVTEAHINITNLTAGVQYEITVTAVAGDSSTEGRSEAISQYTRPGQIGKHTDFTNTSSIFVNWTSPPGEVFLYRVEWHNNGVLLIIYTNNTFTVLSDLIPGTTYIITITAIAGDNRTKGEGYTFNSVTKPAKVGNLSITNVTTTSVSLDWTNLEGNATSYIVQWTAGRDPISDTTNVTFFIINNLIPGSQYNITVAAVAVNPSNKGEETLTTTFTKPEKPENIMIVSRGTGYLKINWTLPKGRADHYVVNISNERPMYSNITADTSALFTNLLPGRIYVITVTSVAGDFSEISDSSLFATEPTPPGSIIIVQRTNSSLHLKWATPAMMEGAPNIGYHINFQTEGGEVQNKSTSVNYTELSSLSSGTSYNITVQTVGPQNLWSTVIHNSAFT
ncbi:receptor-type tyrosine-protein phosphatase eta-like, partial [Plectropomus leopardus]|uniref:receptor-type tyrosine-protein phosphatase eta-like n=1 Tax=Plectropomus leopardus TaxID=160734 RepID=UPI001C4D6E0B